MKIYVCTELTVSPKMNVCMDMDSERKKRKEKENTKVRLHTEYKTAAKSCHSMHTTPFLAFHLCERAMLVDESSDGEEG